MANRDETIVQHYETGEMEERILAGLKAQGMNVDALNAADLAPLDQFHTRGRPATLELAQLAKLQAGEKVLDVGGGLGGSARVVAQDFGCDVTVVDITPEYVQVGEMLTERTRMQDRVHFQAGSAVDLPFEDESFDVVWTQHSSMNVEDKAQMYAEIHRVLRPKGRLALHEIMEGENVPVQFPVPWATMQGISFLEKPEAVEAHIQGAGLQKMVWVEQTDKAIEWFQLRGAAIRAGGPPRIGLELLLGEQFVPMMKNILKNFREGRIRVFMGVFEKM